METKMETEIVWQTPIGPLTASITEKGIRRLTFGPQAPAYPVHDGNIKQIRRSGAPEPSVEGHIRLTENFLANYFANRSTTDIPALDWTNRSEFDVAVWTACAKIGFGRTMTYGELAREVGRPNAARAVGGAMGRNPLPLLVPCHRVVGCGQNRLGGFTGGLPLKKWLLSHECGIGGNR